MSWRQFKREVGTKMNSYTFKDATEFARFFTTKYDEAVKRGVDYITKNPVKKGNKEIMESIIISGMLQGIASTNSNFSKQSYTTLGNGIKAYWTGAELQIMFTPAIPAPGTIANIQTTKNIVTNPGKFSKNDMGPAKDTETFLNTFISLADEHLATIQGIAETISQYPPPASPAKAFVKWSGYKVAKGSSVNQSDIQWDIIFDYGKQKLIEYLKQENIGDDAINLGFNKGAVLQTAFYNLKDFVIADANKGDKLSFTTKEYFKNVITPTALKTIDIGFGTLGFVKKVLFRGVRGKNKKTIKAAVPVALNILFIQMADKAAQLYKTDLQEGDDFKQNIIYILGEIENYILDETYGLGDAILNKVMTI